MKTFLAATLAAAANASSDHWAVIVAGSNTYGNYRHQADTAHAYTILLENNIPASNIIYMAYDDIADNKSNPLPGQLFNKTNGPNVYNADVIDYTGKDVTAEKFIAVLTGDAATAGGRVLESNENSKVFVYYTDHGAPNLVAFPTGGYLYADTLQTAFETMTTNKMYSEMTVYIEACESGSMFPGLTADGNIYGVTASNATESSWASYCGSEAVVNGVSIGSCLGDLFSTNWMEDSDAAVVSGAMDTETLATQYTTVQTETTRSPVLKFGDFSFVDEAIGEFEGNWDSVSDAWIEKFLLKATDVFTPAQEKSREHVDQRDSQLHYLYQRVINEGGDDAHAELAAEVQQRTFFDNIFKTAYPGLEVEELET